MRRIACWLFGHREETTEVYDLGVTLHLTGCTRCDRTLGVDRYTGQYPLPRA